MVLGSNPAEGEDAMGELKRWVWLSMVVSAISDGGLARAEDCVEPDCIRRVPCATAMDCGIHRKCQIDTIVQCPDDLDLSCQSGEGDEECITRTASLKQAECAQVERKLCMPVWQLTCSSDAFCGAGLECVDRGCVATRECKVDSDCPELFRCGVIDGGYCMSGADCVGGQRKLHRCLPPRVEGDGDDGGDRADSVGESDYSGEATESISEGCSVQEVGERASTSVPEWIAVTILGGMIVRSRRLSRRR